MSDKRQQLKWEYLTIVDKTTKTIFSQDKICEQELHSERAYRRCRLITKSHYLGIAFEEQSSIDDASLLMRAQNNLVGKVPSEFDFVDSSCSLSAISSHERADHHNMVEACQFVVSGYVSIDKQLSIYLSNVHGLNVHQSIKELYLKVEVGNHTPLFLFSALPEIQVCNELYNGIICTAEESAGFLEGHPWLLTPIALSQLFRQSWCNALSQGTEARLAFPEEISILSPPGDKKYDCEGVLQQNVNFVKQGRVLRRPLDNLAAAKEGQVSTGHCGYRGVVLDSMKVQSSLSHPRMPARSFILVINVRQFVEVLILTTLHLSPEGKQLLNTCVVRCGDLQRIFAGQYMYGPPLLGMGGWTSPFLLLEQPAKLFDFLMVL